MPNDDQSYFNLGIENDTHPYGWVRCMTSSLEMMAHFTTPEGYTFCGIRISCRATTGSLAESPAVMQLYNGSMLNANVETNMFSNYAGLNTLLCLKPIYSPYFFRSESKDTTGKLACSL
jgi:hypothetical protein